MTLGQQAMAAKRYPDAVKAYTEALRLMPGDGAATRALADAKAADKPPPPPPPDYNKSMQSGQAFERQKMWDAAAAAFRDALKAKPGDAKASFGLDVAEGQKALDAKRWMDAQKSFESALKLFPNDADAKALLKRAKDMK
jgi:tetratricopeptide (TPR) repeat protein